MLLAAVAVPLAAQVQQGTVLYDVTLTLDVELPPEMAAMRDQFPSTRTSTRVLLFNESSSVMTAAPEAEAPADFESGGMRMVFRGDGDDVLYTDRDAGTSVHKRDFLGRTFLVEDAPDPLPWRLTDEQAEFLGYPCFKAVLQRDSTTVEAWFTPEIPVSAGPEHYGGLPGLILLLTENDGRRTFVATEVSLAELEDGAIQVPTGGRRTTREEYDRIVKEKLEDIGRGQRGRIIRLN